MTPLVDVLTRTAEYFRQRGIDTPRLDAELLVGGVLGLDRVKVYLNFDRPMSEAELETLRVWVRRRGAREPLAWILGHKEFFGHDFVVGPGVLVPRPDTETLVEVAKECVGEADPVYVADVGAGSGCVGVALALARPGVRVYAVDREPEPLAVTRTNVERHELRERVAVLRGDLLAAIPAHRPIDWVVSNPPYIPSAEIEALSPEVREHEPRAALDGGADGLDLVRRLVAEAAARARVGLAIEVGAGQASLVRTILENHGFSSDTRRDLGSVERVVFGRRSELGAPPSG